MWRKQDNTNCVNRLKKFQNAGKIFLRCIYQCLLNTGQKLILFFRYFRDTTWSITLYPNNVTDQVVHCHCPKNSLTYIVKKNVLHMPNDQFAFQYLFSCSPQAVSFIQRDNTRTRKIY